MSFPKTLRTRTVWHDDLFATSIAILFCYREPTQTAEIVQQQLWLFAAIHAWVTVASVPLRQTIVEAQFIGILQLLAIDDEVIVSTLRAGFSPCLVCTSYWWILCRLGRRRERRTSTPLCVQHSQQVLAVRMWAATTSKNLGSSGYRSISGKAEATYGRSLPRTSKKRDMAWARTRQSTEVRSQAYIRRSSTCIFLVKAGP